jgi:ankyrin repeat protein
MKPDILKFLLQKLSTNEDTALRTAFVNHRNYSGNTPLHWAALNTHLECVKALVEAGADIAVKNDAGHDAVFLAERAAWDASAENEGEGEGEQTQEIEMTIGEDQGQSQEQLRSENAGEMSPARQVVEWLLGSEKGAAGLESSANAETGPAQDPVEGSA